MYKLESCIHGFDSVCLMDNILYYTLNSLIRPLVTINDDGSYSYDDKAFNQIMSLLQKKILFSNTADDLFEYYNHLDERIDLKQRKVITNEMSELMYSANQENVSLMLNLKDISTPKYINLVRIICKETRKGLGTKYVTKVIELARKYDLMVALTPNSILGTPITILDDFYTGLGFRDCEIIGVTEEKIII